MFNPCFNRKPVELLEDRTDMVIFINLADSAGRVVWDTLETLDRRRNIIIINICWLSYKGYSEPIYNKNIIYPMYLVYLF